MEYGPGNKKIHITNIQGRYDMIYEMGHEVMMRIETEFTQMYDFDVML